MSTTVDQRVVEMRFNNKDFEKNVQTSLGTLKNLNKALDETESGKGLKNLGKGVKNVDLGTLQNSVDQLNNRFSTLGIIGMTALANITNAAMNAGRKIVSGLIGPITSGGFNRALNLENAQFQLKGLLKSGEAVAAVMEDVNYGVQDTAYSLDAAAKVAASLTASGIKAGDAMKTSLRGISGVAAMTNSSYEEIGSIFTTVAGQGKLMTMQLRQLESRGLNAAATLGKQLGKSEAQIRDMVSKGQIDFATFAEAMDDAFGEHAKEANNTFTGALSNMKAALARTGAMFAGSYLENMRYFFNDMRLMINQVNKALAPFAEHVGNIMTNVQRAFTKNLVSPITGKLYLSIQRAINNIVGAFRMLAMSVWNVLSPIGDAFAEAFGKKSRYQIEAVTEKIAEFSYKVAMFTSRIAPSIKDTFKGIFDVLKLFNDLVLGIIKAIFPATGPISSVLELMLKFTAAIGRSVSSVTAAIRENQLFQKVLSGVAYAIRIVAAVLKLLISNLGKILTEFPILETLAGGVALAFGTITAAVLAVIQAISRFINGGWKQLPSLFQTVINKVGELFASFKNLPIISNIAEFLTPAFEAVKKKVMELVESIKKFGSDAIDFFVQLKDKAAEGGLGSAFEFVIGKVRDLGQTLLDLARNNNVIQFLKDFVTGVQNVAKEITPGKIAAMAFTLTFMYMGIQFAKTAKQIGEGVSAIGGFFKNLGGFLKGGKQERLITAVAKAVVMFAVSLVALTQVDQDKLKTAAIILGSFAGGILALSGALMILSKLKLVDPEPIKKMGGAMIGFALAVGILASALLVLSYLGPEEMMGKFLILVGIMVTLGTLAALLGRYSPEFSKGAFSLIAISIGVRLLVSAFNAIDFKGLLDKLKEFKSNWYVLVGIAVGITAALGVFAFLVSKTTEVAKNIAVSFLAVVAAVMVLAHLANYIKELNFDTTQLVQAGAFIGGLILILGLFTIMAKSGKESLNKVAGLFVGLSIALGVMVGLTAILGLMKPTTIAKGIVFLGAIILSIGYVLKQAGKLPGGSAVLSIVAVIGGVVGLMGEMIALTLIPWQDLAAASGSMAIVMLALGKSINLMSQVKMDKTNLFAMIAMIGAIYVMGLTIRELAAIGWENMLAGFVGMAAALLAFGKGINYISQIKFEKENILAMVTMAGVILILTASLTIIAGLGWEQMIAGFVGMAAAMFAFGAAIKQIAEGNKIDPSRIIAMVVMAGVVLVLAESIRLVASLGWEQMLAGLGGMALAMLAFAAAIRIIGETKVNKKALAAMMIMVLDVVAIGAALYFLASLDTDSMLAAALGLSAVMLALAGMTALVASAKMDTQAIFSLLASILALTVVTFILPLISAAIQSFANIDWGTVAKAAVIIGVFTAALAILGAIGEMVALAAVALALVAVSVLATALAFGIMAEPLAAISKLPLLELALGFAALAIGVSTLGVAGILLLLGSAGLKVASIVLPQFAEAITSIQNAGGAGVIGSIGGHLFILAAAGIALIPAAIGLVSTGAGMMMLGNGVAHMAGTDLVKLSGDILKMAYSITQLKGAEAAKAGQELMRLGAQSGMAAMQFNMAVMMMSQSVTRNLMTLPAKTRKSGVDAVQGLLQGIMGSKGALDAAGGGMGTQILQAFSKVTGWSSPWATLIQAGKDGLQGLLQGFQDGGLLGAIKGAVSSLASSIINIFGSIANGIKSFFGGSAGSMIEDLKDQLGDGFDVNLGDGFDLNKWLGDATGGLNDYSLAMGQASQYTEEQIGYAAQYGMTAEEMFGKTEQAAEGFNDLSDAMSNFGGGGGSATQATNAFKELTSTIANQMDIFSEFNRKTEISGTQMLNNMRSQINGVKEWANNLRVLAERGIDQGLLQKLGELGPQGYEKVAAFVQMTDEQLREANDLYGQSLMLPQSAAANVIGSYGLAGQNASAGFVNGINPHAADTVSAQLGANAVNALNGPDGIDAGSPSKKTAKLGVFAVQGFYLGMRKTQPMAEHAVLSFCQAIVRKFTDNLKSSKFEDVGKNVMAGLLKGMEDYYNNNVLSKLERMLNEIKQKMQNALQVESPSRFTMWLGNMLGAGLVKGIEQSEDSVYSSADSLAESAINSLGSTLNYIYDALTGNLDLNPVITPQLDLSNVIDGANQINNMFENRRLLASGSTFSGSTDDQTGNGRQVIFNQYNTSPKALSRSEIYRQTNNQLSRAKVALA